MRPLTSAFLDLLRISAALGVVVSHMATDRFGHHVALLESMGHACVAVFFVLSGFVIAWVVDTREFDPWRYTTARLSRIYSVLVPALIVTIVLDYASGHLDPGFFGSVVGAGDSAPGPFIRALLFLNQSYGVDYNPGSNSPVWSLGYEVPYYAMLGVVLFARGAWRMAAVVALLVIEGPAVWILFPVWLMGVGLYLLIGRRAPAWSTAVVAGLGFVCLGALAPALAGLQTRLYGVEADYAGLVATGRSNQFVIFYTIGLFVCFTIALVDCASPLVGTRLGWLRRTIAYCAGSTFSIYLFHFPVLVVVYCATHYDRGSRVAVAAAFVATVVACVALSYVSERRKRAWVRPIGAVVGLFGRGAPGRALRLRER